jgi:SAM-dependent methyltransferase
MGSADEERVWRQTVDELYSDEVERFYGDRLDAVLDESLHPRGPGLLFDLAGDLGTSAASHVLDVGARDGQQMRQLSERFGCQVSGVEPAPANLARLAAAGGPLPVSRAVAEALPFRAEAFDLVWVRDVLVHVAPLAQAFGEFHRVLRPGGAVLAFAVLATTELEPLEADALFRGTAMYPASADRESFERAVAVGGLTIERVEELHGEWREHAEEEGDRRTSRQLLRVGRMIREPDHYRSLVGDRAYEVELANCLYGIYQLLGKLTATIYVLRRT